MRASPAGHGLARSLPAAVFHPFRPEPLPAPFHANLDCLLKRQTGFFGLAPNASQGGGRQRGALGLAYGQPVGPKLGVNVVGAWQRRRARASLFWVL